MNEFFQIIGEAVFCLVAILGVIAFLASGHKS